MAQSAPGRHERKGITLVQLFDKFPDDATAERWFVQSRWPDGVRCPHCNCDRVADKTAHANMRFRCRGCDRHFSVKTGTVMHSSQLGYQTWAIAIYLVATNLKGISSMKLHRDLGITQKSAWHLLHRIRQAFAETNPMFAGEIEVDESYFGGKRKNMHQWQRNKLKGVGTAGKSAVVGIKERGSNRIQAQPTDRTDRPTLQRYVLQHTAPSSIVYTDDHAAYHGIPRLHVRLRHSVGQYVDGQAHTNGLESFWSLMKRGYHGIYHHFSEKHLHRYVAEFAGRHNVRPLDTADQMAAIVRGADGKRLRYADLIAEPEVKRLL